MTTHDLHQHRLASVPVDILRDLRTRHAEPQRAYHTWQHVGELVDLFAEVEDRLRSPEAVLFAVLFHDAVYDPRRSDNEERSADLLGAAAAGALDAKAMATARRLIDATKLHKLPVGLPAEEVSDARLFIDMDLSILAASPDRFDEYQRQIRVEYAHIPDDAFRTGRSMVLSRFLERRPLFLSDWGRSRFAEQAFTNLQRALAGLTNSR